MHIFTFTRKNQHEFSKDQCSHYCDNSINAANYLSKISASNLLQKEFNSLSIGRAYSYYLKFEDLVKFYAKFVSLSPHNTSQAMQQIREVLL